MGFIIANLEIIVAITSGLTMGGIMFLSKSRGSRENDLTQIYIKYKRHNDSINKSTKSIF